LITKVEAKSIQGNYFRKAYILLVEATDNEILCN